MIAAVLGMGPSLLTTWPGAPAYDLVVAINGAASIAACDWWVFLDREVMDRWQPVAPPRLGIVTDALGYQRQPWWQRCGQQVQRVCEMRAPYANGQYHTSGPAALGFAALRLALPEVHLYGFDMAGPVDFDGRSAAGSQGSAERWKREREQVLTIATAAPGRILRHAADGAVEEVPRLAPGPAPAATRRCGYCGRALAGPRCGRCGTRASV